MYKRAGVLDRIASSFAPGGTFLRMVVGVTQEAVLRRDSWVSCMIDTLVRVRDVDGVKGLLTTASQNFDSAYQVCGALAELYPEQAGAIGAIVRDARPSA